MPLPDGWTASLTDYGIDGDHAPPLWFGVVTFTGPDGASFHVRGSIPAGSVPGDITNINTLAQAVIAVVWPVYKDYALSTIAHLTNPAVPAPPPRPAPVVVGVP